MAFGEKLQEVRKQSGMTQETFAEQLHVSRQAVSRWESGRGYPEIEKILYICHRYHTTLDALFADELPPVEAEEAEVEQPIAGKPLKRSFVDFLSNLSPYDKLIGGTLIFIVLLSLELGAVLWLQIVVFLAVSIAALIATRPLAHKMLDKTIVPTNADRVLHHTAKVTETIDNENTTGAVYIDGKTWTARSEDGDVIARGSMVTIVRMEGVKLFVRKEREEP